MQKDAKHTRHHHHGFRSAVAAPHVHWVILLPLLVIAGLFVAFWLSGRPVALDIHALSPSLISSALLLSLARIGIGYGLSILVAVPLALLVVYNSVTEKIFLPLFDILESIPVLAFFPLLIVFFVNTGFLNTAAVVLLFLSMVWNVLFSLIGGLKLIPTEIKSVAQVLHFKKGNYFSWVLLPALVPSLVTGSIIAVAEGWNVIIVAEVLHTYIPNGTPASDLLGIGNLLVQASAAGDYGTLMYLLAILTIVIGLINFFVWQKLLHYAERFRFE